MVQISRGRFSQTVLRPYLILLWLEVMIKSPIGYGENNKGYDRFGSQGSAAFPDKRTLDLSDGRSTFLYSPRYDSSRRLTLNEFPKSKTQHHTEALHISL